MTKLSKEHYQAEAVVIWCFDARFSPALEELKQKLGLKKIDLVSVAGGAKALAVLNDEASEKAYLLQQVAVSVKLHQARQVVLMTHSDCGAFGGLKAFGDSVEV